jgi:hypothetical protein
MSDTLEMYRGEGKTWQFTASENGAPLNLTSAAIRFVVRDGLPAATEVDDAAALIVKTQEPDDGITITDPAGGVFEVSIVEADTKSLAIPNTGLPTVRRLLTWGCSCTPFGQEPRVLGQGIFALAAEVVRGL